MLISFVVFTLSARFFSNATGLEGNGVFVALLIPLVAIASRLLFWRTPLNFAEHLILVTYIVGHIALLFAGLQVVLLPVDLQTTKAIGYGALALGVAFVPWAYSRVFPSRAFLAAAGGLAALAAGAIMWAVLIMTLVSVLRR